MLVRRVRLDSLPKFGAPQDYYLPQLALDAEFAFSKDLACEVLAMDRQLNDIICGLVVVAGDLSRLSDASALQMAAGHLRALQESVQTTKGELDEASSALSEAPLRRSVAFCKQWVDSVQRFYEVVVKALVEQAMEDLATKTKAVDAECPRWGDNLDDTMMNEARCQTRAVRFRASPGDLSRRQNCIELPGGRGWGGHR
jgi:hypothetical protein